MVTISTAFIASPLSILPLDVKGEEYDSELGNI
jgi:hypothetical protein